MRDCLSSVKYTKNGNEECTPVVKQSHRIKRSHFAFDNYSSWMYPAVGWCSTVFGEGVPWGYQHTEKLLWKAIMPNPVASRTRSKLT